MRKSGANKKAARGITAALLTVIFLLLASYVGLAKYYKGGFSYGTWINGIYCTGKTVEEVNEELLKSCSYEGLHIFDKEGYSYEVSAKDIGFAFDFEEALRTYLNKQNPYLWIDNLLVSKERTLIPVISYDPEQLEKTLLRISIFADETEKVNRDVYIIKTYQGYELVDERAGVLNKQKAKEVIETALNSFSREVYLEEQGCYEDLPLTQQMSENLSLWEKIKEFQSCLIIYKFGDEQVPIDASVVCDWIAAKEDGSFFLNDEGNLEADDARIEEFVERLADEYDTVGGIRHFKATRGETVTVEGGIYGNKLDRRAEKEYLKKAFRDKSSEIHTPQYVQKAWQQGKDDIGTTYIEIDMTKQMMYYYKEGRLEIETAVVTGNTGRRMGTPSGVNYVYAKQENRTLRGPGYAAHVNFWMPVKGNIGIHDASWRSEYGGEIYQTNGSHGCINTPYDKMSELYETAEVGTPVVMFY